MKRFFLASFLLLGAFSLRAQDPAATPIDGPRLKPDSLQTRPKFLPDFLQPPIPLQPVEAPLAIPVFETKEQRAARTNTWVRNSIMKAVTSNMDYIRQQVYKPFLRLAPAGFVPLQASNPMILGREPGKYPFDNPYSPENFPQTVRSEYDFATGKYKLVPIPWEEYQKSHNYRFTPANYNNAPVPQVNLTPGDQIMKR